MGYSRTFTIPVAVCWHSKRHAIASYIFYLPFLSWPCPLWDQIRDPRRLLKIMGILSIGSGMQTSECVTLSPAVAAPSYLHPTFTSTQHATVPSGLELTAAGRARVCVLYSSNICYTPRFWATNSSLFPCGLGMMVRTNVHLLYSYMVDV